MKLIVGLGNPGEQYANTRHNVGATLVGKLARRQSLSLNRTDRVFADVGKHGDEILAIPTTFMNNSGQAVAALLNWFKLVPVDLAVVHDDLDVPLGEVRIRFGGGTAGHNGVASVAYHLETPEFWRVRVGIGPHEPELIANRTADTSGFVLAPFHSTERPLVDQVIPLVCSHLEGSNNPWEEMTLSVRTTEKGPDGQETERAS